MRKGKKDKHIYYAEDEWKVIEEKAEMSNLNTSEYIRQSSLNGFVLVKDIKQFNDVYFELNKIGTNINQVAKLANTVGNVHQSDIVKLEEYFEKLFEMFMKL